MDYKIINLVMDANADFDGVLEKLSSQGASVIHSSTTAEGLCLTIDKTSCELKPEDFGYKSLSSEANFILTLIDRSISDEKLASVIDQVHTKGLKLISIARLSGDEVTAKSEKTCFEIKAQSASNLAELRVALKPVIESEGIDICVLPADFPRENIKLAVFDMDSTLIQCECIDELAKRCGIGEQVSAITASAMRGEINFNESFTKRMALLEGLEEEVLSDIGENLPLTEGVEYLIKTLKDNGYKIALFSGGFYYFANILKEKLGIDHVYANNLPIVDGKVTGKVEGTIVDGQKKKERLIYVAEQEGLELINAVCVGDGANDLPMIKTAGLGVAFHAKPLVREEAGLAVSSIGLDGLLYILGISDN